MALPKPCEKAHPREGAPARRRAREKARPRKARFGNDIAKARFGNDIAKARFEMT